jgi:Mce-associated membrane protein
MSDAHTRVDEHVETDQAASHTTRGWFWRLGLGRQRSDDAAQPDAEADPVDSAAPLPNEDSNEGEESISTLDCIEDDLDDTEDSDQCAEGATSTLSRRRRLSRAICFGILPVLALVAALGAAYLKYQNATNAAAEHAGVESVQAAKESTIAMLSYTPDTVDASLTAARDRLTGNFRDSYSSLIHDVVIPGAKQQQISATATVPAAATISASADHAVALVFVNQAIVVGNRAPSQTSSVVQISLDKIGHRWLISGFDPK